MMRVIVWLWSADAVVQWLGVVLSGVGVALSIWLLSEAHADYRAVAQNGLVERLIARSYRRSQLVILIIQIGFGLTSVLALTLPPIAPQMWVYPGGGWVLTVIAMRKVLRAALILLLALAAVRQAQDRRRALAALREER